MTPSASQLVLDRATIATGCARWFAYSALDLSYEEVAADGPERLARSNV